MTGSLKKTFIKVASSLNDFAIKGKNFLLPVQSVRVLCYHKVGDIDGGVKTKDFSSQMDFLAGEGYAVMPLDDYCAHLAAGSRFVANTAVLTFDDGYEGFMTGALGALLKYRFAATIFIAVNYMGKHAHGASIMTWKQAAEIIAEGMSIGSHSVSHRPLTNMSVADAVKEITDSKKIIEDKIGKHVNDFCYPFGKFNSRIMKAVRDAGYKCASSVIPGCSTVKNEIFALRRTCIGYNDNFKDFKKKITGSYDFVHRCVYGLSGGHR